MGRAIARAFGKQGAKVGLIARDPHRLAATKQEIEAMGGHGLILVADVAKPDQVESAASQVESHFGPIDIWINNAMATIFAPFDEITPEEFKRATEVTYLGSVYGSMAALKRMKPRDKGVIVQVGSALAHRSIPLQSAYCGAKHAIVGFTDSLRSELIHDGSHIHITVVNLPAMNTPQFEWSRSRLPNHPQPVPPIFQPELAADAIVWAAHHHRREVDVGFPTVMATTVQKIAPGLADQYLARTAYENQQTPQPVPVERPDNLENPVAGDYAARGSFNSRAHSRSLQFWVNRHRWALGISASIAAVGYLALRRRVGEQQTVSSPETAGLVIPVLAENRNDASRDKSLGHVKRMIR